MPGATNPVDVSWRCLFATYSPDKDSDIRASVRVLDVLGSGVGKGAVGVTYRRDLDTVQVRGCSIFGQCSVFTEEGFGIRRARNHLRLVFIPFFVVWIEFIADCTRRWWQCPKSAKVVAGKMLVAFCARFRTCASLVYA